MLPGSENTRIRPPRARRRYYILFPAILCRYNIMVCRSDALRGYIRAFYAFIVHVPYDDIKSPYGARTRLFSIYGDGRRVHRATGSRTRAAGARGSTNPDPHEASRGIVARVIVADIVGDIVAIVADQSSGLIVAESLK